ncbi:high-temperature-induced dauer-formation protein-domain-containing protein [Clohesyomyces aquaticus]|uniref:High-temperature-induced dauer-formation protein-domain-containing protein n=1 Tax=Clohesyomyces aquaticus TaxID=1231657 RepID=A0A1Y1Y6A6_9PLEO|nr:high-temperature-induced dauer-formation protein-domain-containing protein [Clohesyomyces aquaticus]
MGASDSKLTFKQGIFRLSEPKQIPADDPYWTGFWELPESAEDIFSLFSPADIRRTRDNNLPNLETLVLAVASRLCVLRNHPSFPDPELAPERDALNCIRVLTRLLPFIYEADHLEAWEDKFFWAARRKRSRRGQLAKSEIIFDEADPEQTPTQGEPEFEPAKPLAEELIDTLIDLLFFSDFTLPKAPTGKPKVTYAIWQSGVGCNTPIASTKEFENNRTEILRLLLTFASKSMYMSANILPVKGVQAITYMATCPDKQVVLSVLCSLLNTTLKYNPASWRVPYDHVVFKDSKQILVTYCLQLLLVLILYPIPEPGNGAPPKNYFRHFLGRLHRPQDFQFLVDGMTRILNQPLQATSTYLPGSHKSLTCAPEMIMLFWEALQCNKRFRSFIIDTDRCHDFVVLVLYYAIDQRNDPTKQGLIRMCVFVLQTLSAESHFGKSLNKVFEGQETLPASIRIPNFHGTYADYLITSIYTLLTTSKGKLDAIYPALLAIINNVAAYVQNLGRAPSSKLLQLCASMSSPSFLFANENNHTLLQSLLEALNAMVEHQYQHNPNLCYAVIRSRKRFQALRDFTLESGHEEMERQNQLKKEQGSEVRRAGSIDSLRSPTVSRTPTLSNVPEENTAFAIGDDDDDSDAETPHPHDPPRSPIHSPSRASRSGSVASSIDEAVPLQLRGMSEKARGKMPVGQPTFSRQNSTTSLASTATPIVGANEFFTPTAAWIDSWLPELPLHTILTLISELSPSLPTPNSTDTSLDTTNEALKAIRAHGPIRGIEPSPVRVHLFEWSPLSLGWYESLLWSFIFGGEMLVSKGTAGVWNNTSIRLFKVQETAKETPSLLAPRGAVDAVGSNLVQRIGSLNLRGGGAAGQNQPQHPGGGGLQRRDTGGNGGASPTVRDV